MGREYHIKIVNDISERNKIDPAKAEMAMISQSLLNVYADAVRALNLLDAWWRKPEWLLVWPLFVLVVCLVPTCQAGRKALSSMRMLGDLDQRKFFYGTGSIDLIFKRSQLVSGRR